MEVADEWYESDHPGLSFGSWYLMMHRDDGDDSMAWKGW